MTYYIRVYFYFILCFYRHFDRVRDQTWSRGRARMCVTRRISTPWSTHSAVNNIIIMTIIKTIIVRKTCKKLKCKIKKIINKTYEEKERKKVKKYENESRIIIYPNCKPSVCKKKKPGKSDISNVNIRDPKDNNNNYYYYNVSYTSLAFRAAHAKVNRTGPRFFTIYEYIIIYFILFRFCPPADSSFIARTFHFFDYA